MALHAPTIHPPMTIHVPGWLVALVVTAVVLLVLGVALTLIPASQPESSTNEAYQDYRAGERSVMFDPVVQQAWQDYRAGERDLR